jgi:hypothetical protein
LWESLHENEKILAENLKEGGLKKFWERKTDLDPHMFDIPKEHLTAAAHLIDRKDFADARKSLRAAWDLIDIAEKILYKYKTGIEPVW